MPAYYTNYGAPDPSSSNTPNYGGVRGGAALYGGALHNEGQSFQGRQGGEAALSKDPNIQTGINNQAQSEGLQGGALDYINRTANGEAGPEVAAMRQGLQVGQANNLSLAHSAASGSAAALAHRNAAMQNATLGINADNSQNMIEAQAQRDAAMQYAQGAAQARGQSLTELGNQQGLATAEGGLIYGQNAQNDAMQGAYDTMGQNIYAGQLGADTSKYISDQNAAQQAALAKANSDASWGKSLLGGAVSAGEGIAGAAMMGSDIRMKGDISPQGASAMNYGRPPMGGGMPQGPMTTQAHPMGGGGPMQLATTLGPRGRNMGAMGGPPAPPPMQPMAMQRPPMGPPQSMPPQQMMGAPRPPMPSPQMMQAMRPPMGGAPGQQMGAPSMGPPQMGPQQMMARRAPMPGQQMMAPPGAQPQMPPQMSMMSDERAKMVDSSLMSTPMRGYPPESDGRGLLMGPADANRSYNPYDAYSFVREQYPANVTSDMNAKTQMQPQGFQRLNGPPGLHSDERTKEGIGARTKQSGGSIGSSGSVSEGTKGNPPGFGSEADHFLDHLKPYTYRYKDPSYEPTSQPTGGHYLGVMAQDVERAPGVGQQIVKETPRGKMLEGGALLSAVTAGVGRLHERVSQLEGRRGR